MVGLCWIMMVKHLMLLFFSFIWINSTLHLRLSSNWLIIGMKFLLLNLLVDCWSDMFDCWSEMFDCWSDKYASLKYFITTLKY